MQKTPDTDDGGKPREMLTAEQVLQIIPVSRTTLFRIERDNLFPRGVLLTPHRKLWFRDEVVQWQRDLQDRKSALSRAVELRKKKNFKPRDDDEET